jgi:uncharacterized protein (TIGR02646 family)
MIRLPDIAIPDDTQALLDAYQAEVDGASDFASQVAKAKQLFSARNKSTNPAFRVIRRKLDELCGGAGRCCYCELSQPDEIEHVRPKDWYPEAVFAWSNYAYSCGPCNAPKNNQFAVFKRRSRKPTYLVRGKGDPVAPPPVGRPVIIDPRTETPLNFMELDLAETFLSVETADEGTREYERAKYTIEVLRLNERDVLTKARRSAFHSYRAILKEVLELKASGASPSEIDTKRIVIQELPHPAVWQEMKRQRMNDKQLARLFTAIPEAMTW